MPIFSTGMIGQYAHGNEPSHHVIYLYNKVGQHWKTQKYVAQVLHDLYLNAPDGICGNEDCGQMSAWFVFSATDRINRVESHGANFSPDDYTEDICESNGWQYFWSVPQDLDGLIGL